MDTISLSNRGLLFSTLNIPIWLTLALLLIFLVLGIMMIIGKITQLRGFLNWVLGTMVVFVLASVMLSCHSCCPTGCEVTGWDA